MQSQTCAIGPNPPSSLRYNPLSAFKSNWWGAEIVNQFLSFSAHWAMPSISQHHPPLEFPTPAACIVVLPDNYKSSESEDHLFSHPTAFDDSGEGQRFPRDGPPGPPLDDNDPNFPNDDLFTPDPNSGKELLAEQIPMDMLAMLASAIQNLTHSSHEPNGTDPWKLQVFLVQCKLNYHNRPKAFCTNHTKGTFAQLYLKGMALEWFKPDLLLMEDPALHPL